MCPDDFPQTSNRRTFLRTGLPAALAIGLILALLGAAPDAAAQYEVRKPAGRAAQQASITVDDPAAGTTWAQGKRYDVTWQSAGLRGGVKIELVDAQGAATLLVRQTANSGKYTFMLKPNVADGAYRIRVSSADGKVIGVTSATVQVGKVAGGADKVAATGAYQPAVGARPTGATGTTATTAAGATTATATRPPVGLAGDRDAGTVAGTTVVQVGNLTPLQVPERDLHTITLPEDGLVVAPGFLDLNRDQDAQPGEPDPPSITVNDPDGDDAWVAGTPYQIRWGSDNLDGPVKIHLVHAVSAQQYDLYPATYNTPNTGAFTYTPPAMLGCGHDNFYVQVASLDEQTKGFAGPIHLYHEPVDMTGKVMGLRQSTESDYYVVYAESDEYLKFDVWFRNNGTQQATTVQTIRVLVIKEPEEVVIDNGHQEFGFGNMAPRVWYKTPDPFRFHIRGRDSMGGREVDLRNGAYRVEVTVDPSNLLGEDPPMREDNHFVKRFMIR